MATPKKSTPKRGKKAGTQAAPPSETSFDIVLEERRPAANGLKSPTDRAPERAEGNGIGHRLEATPAARLAVPPPPTPKELAIERLKNQQNGLSQKKRYALENLERVLHESSLRSTLIVPRALGERGALGEIKLEEIPSTFFPPIITRTLTQAHHEMRAICAAMEKYFGAVADENTYIPPKEGRDLPPALASFLRELEMRAGVRVVSTEEIMGVDHDGPGPDDLFG